VKLRHRLLLRLLRYLKPHWPTVVAGGLLALVVSGAGGLIAWLVKPAMDDIFLRRDLVMLKRIPLALLGVYLVKGATSYGESYLMASVGERVVAQLRRELYVHIQGMPLSFFSTRHSGELTTRLVLDVNRIAALASDVLVSTLRRAGTIVALLAVMLTHDWLLTLMAAAMVPVAGIVNWPLGRQLYRINRRAQELSGALSVLLLESLTGRKIVKGHSRRAHRGDRRPQRIDRERRRDNRGLAALQRFDVAGG